MLRPRDAIAFVNTVLEKADGRTEITAKMVLDAERTYSEKRLNAIFHEWFTDYPKLEVCIEVLRNKPTRFTCDVITKADMEDIVLKLLDGSQTNDQLEALARKVLDNKLGYEDFRVELINLFFKVGFIGIRICSGHPFVYSSSSSIKFPHAQIQSDTTIQIHPMFWWAMGNKKLKGYILEPEAQQ